MFLIPHLFLTPLRTLPRDIDFFDFANLFYADHLLPKTAPAAPLCLCLLPRLNAENSYLFAPNVIPSFAAIIFCSERVQIISRSDSEQPARLGFVSKAAEKGVHGALGLCEYLLLQYLLRCFPMWDAPPYLIIVLTTE